MRSGLNSGHPLTENGGGVHVAKLCEAAYKPLPRLAGLWSHTLSARVRKLIGLVALLAFVLFYVGAVVQIGQHIPDHWAARLAYYGLSGIAWGLPVLPLISWMNRGR